MPTVLRVKSYRLYFYSNEGSEPIHIHIEKANASCKIWLEPSIEVEYCYGFSPKEMKEVNEIVSSNLNLLKNAWDEYFKK